MTAFGRIHRFGPGEGRAVAIGADRLMIKGTASERADGFAVVEYEGAPGVPGPPPHRHATFDEAWFVLDGEVVFTSGRETVPLSRGSYLLVPRGAPHTFHVPGPAPARWLGIFSPGRYVALLEELGELMPAHGPPDAARVDQLFRKYDTEVVPE